MSLLRSWPLYVGLACLTVGLYASGRLSARNIEGPPLASSPARTLESLPDLRLEEVLSRVREQPEAALLLSGWMIVGLTLTVSGLGLGIRELVRIRRRRPAAGRVPYLWPFADALRLLLLIAFVLMLLPFVHLLTTAAKVEWLQDTHVWSLVGMLIAHAMLLLLVWGFGATHGVSLPAMFGLSPKLAGPAAARGLRGYVIAFPWIFGLLAVVGVVAQRFGIKPSVETIHELIFLEQRGGVLALTVLMACVIGPIAEEIVFRGVIFSTLRRRCSSDMAALLSGALFAAMHTNLIGFLPIVALGTLLAERYERTGSLWASIAIHMVHNAFLMGLGLTLKEFL